MQDGGQLFIFQIIFALIIVAMYYSVCVAIGGLVFQFACEVYNGLADSVSSVANAGGGYGAGYSNKNPYVTPRPGGYQKPVVLRVPLPTYGNSVWIVFISVVATTAFAIVTLGPLALIVLATESPEVLMFGNVLAIAIQVFGNICVTAWVAKINLPTTYGRAIFVTITFFVVFAVIVVVLTFVLFQLLRSVVGIFG
ncbi:MAG: hypothetical protein JNL67_21980 [Planctomycetaceae bacterium]|nr:hypothetical protein [Planctomycetaceae bacterium]